MKKTIIYILISISQFYVNAQCYYATYHHNKNITSFERENLKGKVKSFTDANYEIADHFGELSKGKKNCEEKMFFNRDSTLNKNVIEYFKERRNDKDVRIFEYEKGEIKFISNYDKDGILKGKTVFITEGNDIREQYYSSDGKPSSYFKIHTYDLNGNKVKRVEKQNDSQFDTIFYDKNNRISEIQENGRLSKVYYRDDLSIQVVKVVEDKDIIPTVVVEYDSNGNVTKEYWRGKLSRSYEYEYDGFGNWTKRIEFAGEAKIPVAIIERIIDYYE